MPKPMRGSKRKTDVEKKSMKKLKTKERSLVLTKDASRNLYISRNKAVKYLQLTLGDFLRVCINNNVFPRVPGSKFEGETPYYLKSDIKQLQLSPYVQFLRQQKVHKKKIISLRQQRLFEELEILRLKNPEFDYSTLIQQKYPTFEMALADLSDCLSTLALCSVMSFGKISSSAVQLNRSLLQDFRHYCCAVQAFRKCFVTVKGCYFQAVISSAEIIWLEPFQTAFSVPDVVESRLFANFCEFYQNLMKCVNLRLYGELGVQYQVGACQLRRQQALSVAPQQAVFQGLKFFVSRECQREWIHTLILSGGGAVSESAEQATHAVFDRQADALANVEMVSPQYVFDCFNCGFMLPASEYQCGQRPPAHLSPFQFRFDRIEGKDGEYVPERLEQIVQYYRAFVERTGEQTTAPAVDANAGADSRPLEQPLESQQIGQVVHLQDAEKELSSEEEFRETDALFAFMNQPQDLDIDDAERLVRGRMSQKRRQQYDEIVGKEKAALQERERLIRKRMELKKKENAQEKAKK